MQTLAIDFDGVIHRYSEGWQEGVIYDPPNKGTKEALEQLAQKFNIIIFTTRLNPNLNNVVEQTSKMEKWLGENGFVKNVHYHELTGYKPKAKLYLDDRALRFTNWQTALKDIATLI